MENQKLSGENRVSLPCLVLCALLVLILSFVPVLASSLTRWFRPVFILTCVCFSKKYRYRMSGEVWLLAFLAYLALILLANPITNTALTSYVSMLLFGLFFVLAAVRIWTKREIHWIIEITILACTVCAVVQTYSGFETVKGARVAFLSHQINRNTSCFSVVPGGLCATFALSYYTGKSCIRKIWYIFSVGMPLYVISQLGCRSAFAALAAGIFLVLWQTVREDRNTWNVIIKHVLLVIGSILAMLILQDALQGGMGSRLFDWSDSSGRDVLWGKAWNMIREKPLFGGGFDWWTGTGTHNAFLTYMVVGGWIAGILLVLFLGMSILECLKVKNYIPLAFMTEAVCHTLSEPGIDYYAYIPLTLAYILVRYLQNSKMSLQAIFQ